MESKSIELEHELHGFQPGNEGSAIVAYNHTRDGEPYVSIATKYAVDFEESLEGDGWEWAPSTHLNINQIAALRDFLSNVLEGGA